MATVKAEPTPEPTVETVDLEPGFYVTANNVVNGPYPTAADAEDFIIGQLTPQGIEGTVTQA